MIDEYKGANGAWFRWFLRAFMAGISRPPMRQFGSLFLNQALGHSVAAGDLDFLEDRVLRIAVTGVDGGCLLSVRRRQLAILRPDASPEVTIRASVEDFGLLATRRIDADTLFFQRRLVIEGDVSLGLMVKNYLDALDIDTLPWLVRGPLTMFEKYLAHSGADSRRYG